MIKNNAYGPRLFAYLSEYWEATGTNQNAWCLRAGLQGSTVSRWEGGAEPRTSAFRQVADALEVPIIDLFIAAGVITTEEANGRTVEVPTLPDIDDAIARDPSLSDVARVALAGMLGGIRDVESGGQGTEAPRRRTHRR